MASDSSSSCYVSLGNAVSFGLKHNLAVGRHCLDRNVAVVAKTESNPVSDLRAQGDFQAMLLDAASDGRQHEVDSKKGAAVGFKTTTKKSGKAALRSVRGVASKKEAQKELTESASSGNVAIAKAALAVTGLNVDAVDEYGNTALISAARNGHAVVVTALLDKGATVDSTNNNGNTALICAARNGHPTVCGALLAQGAAVDFITKDGSIALISAAYNGHAAVCTTLLDKGAAADITDEDGGSALIWAAGNGHARVCTALLDKGAAVDLTSQEGDTALICAAYRGHTAACIALLDKGAAVDLTDKDGNTALMYAAQKGHTTVCTTLLDKGAASMNLTNNSGETALQVAQASGQPATVIAIRRGMWWRRHQKQLRESACSGNVAIVKAILGMAGLNVDAVNANGNTALIFAARFGHVTVCTDLLDIGASVNVVNKNGNTALIYAARNGHVAVCMALLGKGAAIDVTNKMGKTALEVAEAFGHTAAASAIRRAVLSYHSHAYHPQLLPRPPGLVQYMRPPPAASYPPTRNTGTASAGVPPAAPTQADAAAAASRQLSREVLQLVKEGAVPEVACWQPGMVAWALEAVIQLDTTQEALFKLHDKGGEGRREDAACESVIEARNAAAATACKRGKIVVAKLTEARDWWTGRLKSLQHFLGRATELQTTMARAGTSAQQVGAQEEEQAVGWGNRRGNYGANTKLEPDRRGKVDGGGEGRKDDSRKEGGGSNCQAAAPPAAPLVPVPPSNKKVNGALLRGRAHRSRGRRAILRVRARQHDEDPHQTQEGMDPGGEQEVVVERRQGGASSTFGGTKTAGTGDEGNKEEDDGKAQSKKVNSTVVSPRGQVLGGSGLAVEQMRWCAEMVRRELIEAHKAENRCMSALARVSDGLEHVTKFKSAQAVEARVRGSLQAALNSRYVAEDRVEYLRRRSMSPRGARECQKRRWITGENLEPELSAARADLRSLLRSKQYCGALAAARDMLLYLPELAIHFPVLDPFSGSASQGLHERDFSEYVDVVPGYEDEGGGGGGDNLGGHFILLKAKLCREVIQQEGGKSKQVVGEGGDVNRWCVLKGFRVDEEEWLGRELHALRYLKHPNIVPLRAICRHRDPIPRYFLELPYYPHNLTQWLVARGEVHESEEDRHLAVVGLLKGVLKGVEYLHQKHMFHGDLRPENILITAEGVPVITGFENSSVSGDARSLLVVNSTIARRTLVPPDHAAPEVASEGYSQASDMYSFGLMVAQALLGLRVSPTEIPGAVRERVTAARGEGRPGVPSTVSRLEKEQLGVLERLLSPDAGCRPSAGSLLLHSTSVFRVKPRVRTCVICLTDDIPLMDGLECAGGWVVGGEGDDGTAPAVHFTCKACFSTYITSQSEEELHKLERRGGEVMCPKWLSSECGAPAYTDAKVAQFCSPAVFALYVGQRVRLAERQLASEMARDHAKKLETELARLRQMDERTRRVEMTAAQVRELLNNACPRCKAAFFDFDGCCALRCHRCKAAFCAWCLADCGNDAHQHVSRCNKNLAVGRQVYGTQAQWLQASRLRFRENVTALLDRVVARDGASPAADVARAVARELTDVGIGDIMGQYAAPPPSGAVP